MCDIRRLAAAASASVAAAFFVFIAVSGVSLAASFSAHAASLEMSLEAAAVDADNSQWVAMRPAGDQPFTFWAAGQDGAAIDWALPDGAALGETVWPQVHLLAGDEAPTLAFAGDAVILQEINSLPDERPHLISATMSYAICDPDTGFCAAAEASGDLDASSTNPGLFAAAREASAPFRRSGIMTRVGDGAFHMGVNKHANDDDLVTRAFFLPFTPGLLAAGGALELEPFETGFFSSVESGNARIGSGKIRGLLVLQKPGTESGMGSGMGSGTAPGDLRLETHLLAEPNDFARAGAAEDATAYGSGLSLLQAVLFALVGGMILNLMPCVFPILAMKAFALVRAGSESQQALRSEALIYTAGILTSFMVLAGVLIFVRSLGQQVGWGFQLQSPAFIFVVTIVLFLVGLNLLGVFQMGTALQSMAGKLSMRGAQDGRAGAYMTGVLATVVATPCTAPFMAPAIGFALTQSAAASLGIFAALGLGLALPYLIISYSPAIQRRFPAPGPWMVRFKEFLAFPMFATIVWLVWILETQAGALGVIVVLGAMVLAGLGIWLVKQLAGARAPLRRSIAAVMIVLVLAPALVPNALPQVTRMGVQTRFSPDVGIHTEVYSEARLNELRAAGRPVFLHFWASWCIICLMHENLVFSTDEFQTFLADNNMVFMEINNTLENPANVVLMESFGRSGQPLDIFFPGEAGAPALVLPALYDTGKVLGLMAPHM